MRKNECCIPTSYASAARELAANGNTRSFIGLSYTRGAMQLIRGEHNAIHLTLYGTRIVTFHANGDMTLNSGGYRTATTKAKINAALRGSGVAVAQVKGTWVIRSLRPGASPQGFATFRDNMRLMWSVDAAGRSTCFITAEDAEGAA